MAGSEKAIQLLLGVFSLFRTHIPGALSYHGQSPITQKPPCWIYIDHAELESDV